MLFRSLLMNAGMELVNEKSQRVDCMFLFAVCVCVCVWGVCVEGGGCLTILDNIMHTKWCDD